MYKLVDIIRLVAMLFQQVQYSHDMTILLQPCVVNLVTLLLYHDCIGLVRFQNNLVTSLTMPSSLLELSCQQLLTTLLILSDLLQGCSNKSGTVMI
jgi:hypothetical protein